MRFVNQALNFVLEYPLVFGTEFGTQRWNHGRFS